MSLRRSQVEELFKSELPGIEAHDEVIGYTRPTVNEILESEKEPRLSSVVFLMYPKSDGLHFLLLKRHDYKGVHSGQVGLPGGRLDDTETKEQAMMRELYEETGYYLDSKNVLNELTPLYIPPSNFIVHPFAAIIDEEPTWKFDKREVKRGIETPLIELMKEDVMEESKVRLSGGEIRINVKSFPFGGETVWGATAMILSECKQILSKFGP